VFQKIFEGLVNLEFDCILDVQVMYFLLAQLLILIAVQMVA
jgi:hypothetical protein